MYLIKGMACRDSHPSRAYMISNVTILAEVLTKILMRIHCCRKDKTKLHLLYINFVYLGYKNKHSIATPVYERSHV